MSEDRPEPHGPTIHDLDRDELEAALVGEPAYRVEQTWHGLYGEDLPVEEISTLPAELRRRLAERFPPALSEAALSRSDDGDTLKWLWELRDGAPIETVLMHYPATSSASERSTVCVSTQAGCAMACGFCATGQGGFERQLSVGEIVEQVVLARRHAASDPRGPRRVSNVVFMGMGEPLANYEATWGAVRRLHDDMGIGARRITLSTVGIVPGIRRLAGEDLPVNLAVSLHAAHDELRDELVPVNRRYPLAELLESCEEYFGATGRRVTFEWALIEGVNDRFEDADRLVALNAGLRAHVNLIPLNPTPGYGVRGSSRNRVHAFAARLEDRGVNVTIRDTRGSDIDAACGQLRATGSAAPGVR